MEKILTLDPQKIEQKRAYHFLASAVAPRPICFASTVDKQGRVNLSPFSFFNVFSSNPPIVVFAPVRRGRDNTTKNTHDNVLEHPEVVVNIVNYPMVEQMSLASTEYDKGVNEFVKAGFTEMPSLRVKPPRVAEAPVSFECSVEQVISLGDGPGAGSLVIAKVLLMHVQEKYLDVRGKLDTTKLDLVGRMGGKWYTRAIPDSLFAIPKPQKNIGIGVDRLPESVRNSRILSGNNLGRLGNLKELPAEHDLQEIEERDEIRTLLQEPGDDEDRRHKLHELAKTWIDNGEAEQALSLLLIADRLK